jgi:hypothetical protein
VQPRGRLFALFLVVFAALILIRAVPLARVYVEKLLSLHSLRAVAGGVVAIRSGSGDPIPRGGAAAFG